jgi:hypothetical protein
VSVSRRGCGFKHEVVDGLFSGLDHDLKQRRRWNSLTQVILEEFLADGSARNGEHADAGGGGQQDGRLDVAHFIYLSRAGQFSETTAHKDRARHFFAIEIARIWQHGAHTGADVVAAVNGGVSDFDAGDVGDGIARSGWKDTDLDAQVGGTGGVTLGDVHWEVCFGLPRTRRLKKIVARTKTSQDRSLVIMGAVCDQISFENNSRRRYASREVKP